MVEVMPAHARGHIALLVPHQDDVQDLSLPAGVDLRWFVGNPEQAATLVAHFTAQPMVAEGSYFWFGGEESLVVPLRRHVRRAWMPSASGSTQSPTGAAARMKTPTIRTGTP
jgi:NADPH-dependent ferric siderophore reductase